MRKLWLLVLAGLIGVWAFPACDDSDGDGDADVDGDADGDSDGDGDGDGDADGDGDGDGDADGDLVCQGDSDNWWCCQADPQVAQMRVTSLEITAPPALALDALQGIIGGSMDDFGFLWLMEVNFTDSTLTTGAGALKTEPASPEEFCSASWSTTPAPVADIPITITGEAFSTTNPVESISIPVYSGGSLLLTLPLSQLALANITFNTEHTLIGTNAAAADSTQVAATWEEAGELSGWLSFDDAQDVVIEALMGQTLCQLLCGPPAGQDCTTIASPADCTNPPTDIPGVTPAVQGWELVATVGAGAITIQ